MRAPAKLFLASSNPGKVAEYRVLAAARAPSLVFELELLPDFDALPEFEENAPTFAENAAGKALHYSRERRWNGDSWKRNDQSLSNIYDYRHHRSHVEQSLCASHNQYVNGIGGKWSIIFRRSGSENSG